MGYKVILNREGVTLRPLGNSTWLSCEGDYQVAVTQRTDPQAVVSPRLDDTCFTTGFVVVKLCH